MLQIFLGPAEKGSSVSERGHLCQRLSALRRKCPGHLGDVLEAEPPLQDLEPTSQPLSPPNTYLVELVHPIIVPSQARPPSTSSNAPRPTLQGSLPNEVLGLAIAKVNEVRDMLRGLVDLERVD